MSTLTQVTTPFQSNSGALPLLKTEFGKTISAAVTTTAGAAVQLFTTACARGFRIWAIGCPIIYVTGPSGVAVPAATDGYVAQDAYIETWTDEVNNYIRVAAASGSGSVKIELLA